MIDLLISLKFVIDSLNELELELKKFNVNLYVFEGNLRDFANYMNQNHPNSNLHMNHTTETEYFSRNLKALKQNFSLSVNEYKDFGIQITNQNRDKWASDWQNYMKSETYKTPLKSKKNFKTMNLPKFSEFKNYVNNDHSTYIQKGGTVSGKGLLTSFLEKRCKGYSKKMSNPSDAAISCSRLSPHIAFGTLSMRSIYQELEKNINNSKYRWDLYSFKKDFIGTVISYKNLIRNHRFNINQCIQIVIL